jgi:hypothetical protein
MPFVPFERDQTAIPLPSGASAICGSSASRPTTERSTGVCQSPVAAGRTAPATVQFAPFQRSQTATAFPAPSKAILGTSAYSQAPDKSLGASHVPVVMVRTAPWTR